VALHVAVLAMPLRGGARCDLASLSWCSAAFMSLPFGREVSGRSPPASTVFAASALIAFNELNWLAGRFNRRKEISSGGTGAVGA
jgi:hypothetical protein